MSLVAAGLCGGLLTVLFSVCQSLPAGKVGLGDEATCSEHVWPCEAVAYAFVAGVINHPIAHDAIVEARRVRQFPWTLDELSEFLQDVGVPVELRRITPTELIELKSPAVVVVRVPGGHSHFEVFVRAEERRLLLADATTLENGSLVPRKLDSFARSWDGRAILIKPGWIQALVREYKKLVLPGIVYFVSLYVAWRMARRIGLRRSRGARA